LRHVVRMHDNLRFDHVMKSSKKFDGKRVGCERESVESESQNKLRGM
jgi:hypothetical protein